MKNFAICVILIGLYLLSIEIRLGNKRVALAEIRALKSEQAATVLRRDNSDLRNKNMKLKASLEYNQSQFNEVKQQVDSLEVLSLERSRDWGKTIMRCQELEKCVLELQERLVEVRKHEFEWQMAAAEAQTRDLTWQKAAVELATALGSSQTFIEDMKRDPRLLRFCTSVTDKASIVGPTKSN